MNVEVAHTLHERGVEEAAEAEQDKHERHERVLGNSRAWPPSVQDWLASARSLLAVAYRRAFSTNFAAWLQATTAGKKQLANLYVRRFSPEYRVAFVAWVKAGGLTDPNAPPGPSFMPQYHNHLWQNAAAEERQAHGRF